MSEISFCFVAPQGSGKSLISKYVHSKYPHYKMIRSGPTWDLILGQKLSHYERTIRQKEIVEKHGEQYFVNFVMENLIEKHRKEDPNTRFIVDGLRSKELLDALRNYFGKEMAFIGVMTDSEIRFNRLVKRDDPEKVKERDRRDEEQFRITELTHSCDIKLVNNYDQEHMIYKDVDKLIRENSW